MLLRLFFGSRASPSPPLTKIPGSAHRKQNYVHANVMITSKVIFKDFPTAIFPSYGTTVSFSIPQTYHPLIMYRLTFCKLIELMGGS